MCAWSHTCTCVCMVSYMHMCVHGLIHAHVCAWSHTCTCVCTVSYMHMCVHGLIHVHVCAWSHACTCVCTVSYMHMCVHGLIHAHVCARSHTCTCVCTVSYMHICPPQFAFPWNHKWRGGGALIKSTLGAFGLFPCSLLLWSAVNANHIEIMNQNPMLGIVTCTVHVQCTLVFSYSSSS